MAQRGSQRNSMLKEELPAASHFEDIELSKEVKEDLKKSEAMGNARDAGILPPQYFELQSAAVPPPPPPPYGTLFTGVKSMTKRWLICLTAAIVALAVILVLVIFLAVRPAAAAAATQKTTTVPRFTVTSTAPPQSAVGVTVTRTDSLSPTPRPTTSFRTVTMPGGPDWRTLPTHTTLLPKTIPGNIVKGHTATKEHEPTPSSTEAVSSSPSPSLIQPTLLFPAMVGGS